MNVKEAFERLKSARAYSGKNIYLPWHSNSQRVDLDKSYREAVDTLENSVSVQQFIVDQATENALRFQVEGLTKKLQAQQEAYEALRRSGQVSEEFRKDPNSRRWDTSYTKRVVDALRRIATPALVDKPIKDAIELLTDYHTTLHVPYQQRDQAREALAVATEKHARSLADVKHRVLKLKGELIRRIGRSAVLKLIVDVKTENPAKGRVIGSGPPDTSIFNTSIDQLGLVEHALRSRLEALDKAPASPTQTAAMWETLRTAEASKLFNPFNYKRSEAVLNRLTDDLRDIMNESEEEYPADAAKSIAALIDAKIAESKQ